MAGKRTATSDLNHDNWDDYEPEEAGTFQKAPDEILQKRVIKTARRRRPIGEESSTKNVFSNFSGFGKPAAQSSSESPFAFLANCPPVSHTLSKTNGISTPTSSSSIPVIPSASASLLNFKPQTAAPLLKALQTTKSDDIIKSTDSVKSSENGTAMFTTSFTTAKTQNSPALDSNNLSDSKSTEYYSNLKGLNESVSQWIKTHVDKNPFCILTPIFKDYEKYLKEIESKKEKKELENNISNNISNTKMTAADNLNNVLSTKSNMVAVSLTSNSMPTGTPTFNSTHVTSTTSLSSTFNSTPLSCIFGQGTTKAPETSIFVQNAPKPLETNIFGQNAAKSPEVSFFASKPTTNPEKINVNPEENEKLPFASNTKTLSFGTPSTTFGQPSAFSFNKGTPFTFPNVAKPPSENREEEDDEEEPPESDFTPVVEEDHIYTKRCKVFVRKDGNYGDRGVGQLFLKPVSGSEKVQLIVRADTNLGNLLLNFILSDSVRMQRMGKNNVMMVCIPMPDAKPPPVPVLLRVKTAEEADDLLKVLEKNKK